MADLAALERLLGHDFADRGLLETALTHPSLVGHGASSYERLEFLGDRVLGLSVADLLMERYPRESEGDLARRHALLVDRDSLAHIAASIGLGDWLRMTDGETAAGTRENASVLSDAMEAVIGAVYRDDGFDTAAAMVRRFWLPFVELPGAPPRDAKTALQEWAQARALPLPSYSTLSRTGPDHAPLFTVEVTVRGYPSVQAEGGSRRAAERAAAAALYAMLEPEPQVDG
jgi:ribonuclease-3